VGDNPAPAEAAPELKCFCGSSAAMVSHSHRLSCPDCGSFLDIPSLSGWRYGDDYPKARNHFDGTIGELKTRTMMGWLRRAGLNDFNRMVVCEVGFGGGFCLRRLHTLARKAYGVEIVESSINHAHALGIPRDHLLHFERLPPILPDPVDLWIFQDSFEHIPDPGVFVDWAIANSSNEARMMVVAPCAGSWSDRVFGRFWMHRVPEHRFHWSIQGLTRFFSLRNFVVTTSFYPWKYISIKVVLSHIFIMANLNTNELLNYRSRCFLSKVTVKFNIGEFGLVFGRVS